VKEELVGEGEGERGGGDPEEGGGGGGEGRGRGGEGEGGVPRGGWTLLFSSYSSPYTFLARENLL
jgi:hypothetical protein